MAARPSASDPVPSPASPCGASADSGSGSDCSSSSSAASTGWRGSASGSTGFFGALMLVAGDVSYAKLCSVATGGQGRQARPQATWQLRVRLKADKREIGISLTLITWNYFAAH